MQIDVPSLERDAPAVSAVQRALLLKTFPGFVGMGSDELALLAAVTKERFFPKGAVIHKPGVPVLAFHFVVEGKVQMFHDGKPSKMFGERATIGGLAALTRSPEGAHAVALEDTLALEVDTDDMQDVFEDNFRILSAVLKAMARTLRELQMSAGGGAVMGADSKHVGLYREEPLTLVDKMFFLRRTTNFGDTSIEALAELASEAIEHRYREGDTIWTDGEDADYSILLVHGAVQCTPRDAPAFEFATGFIVGGLDALSEQPHWYDCVAKTDVVALHMLRQSTFDLIEDNVEMGMEMLRRFAAGINAIMGRMAATGAGDDDGGDEHDSAA